MNHTNQFFSIAMPRIFIRNKSSLPIRLQQVWVDRDFIVRPLRDRKTLWPVDLGVQSNLARYIDPSFIRFRFVLFSKCLIFLSFFIHSFIHSFVHSLYYYSLSKIVDGLIKTFESDSIGIIPNFFFDTTQLGPEGMEGMHIINREHVHSHFISKNSLLEILIAPTSIPLLSQIPISQWRFG